MFALKATPNGDCLFNASSILVHGNKSAAMFIRLIVAGEWYFNTSFYAGHDAFVDTIRSNTDLSLDTLFTVALSEAGADKYLETGSKTKKFEVLVACTRGRMVVIHGHPGPRFCSFQTSIFHLSRCEFLVSKPHSQNSETKSICHKP